MKIGAPEPKPLLQTVQRSLKWSVLAEIISKAVGPVAFLALARILTPEDFGVVGAAMLVISFTTAFWEAGLSKALIQRQEDPEKTATTVFWMNLGLSLGIASLLAIFAGIIAHIFHDPRIASVVRVLALQLPLAALGSVQTALLQKKFQFQKLFWVRLITTAAPGAMSVPLALGGMGYWALIAGTLFGAAAQSATLWFLSEWRPSGGIDFVLARKLWRFGIWMMAEGLLGWFYSWGDSFLVGMFLGTHELGVYRAGSVFVGLVFSVALAPAMPVIYSAFTRFQEDRTTLVKALLRTQKALFAFALPIGIGLFLLKDSAAAIVFKDKWTGVASVIGYLGLIQGLSWLMGANTEAYKAINKPDIFTKIMSIGLIYYVPAYYFALHYGIQVFLWTRLGLFLVSQIIHFIALRQCLAIGPSKVFSNSKNVFLSTILFLIGYYGLQKATFSVINHLPAFVEHVIRIVIFGLAVVTVYYFMLKKDFTDILGSGFFKIGRKKRIPGGPVQE